ncbi:hypothetical protein [Variovorax ginsengisoli]|uniref:Uncharacterized protein n=1 Tax=Variovorax ginsengisoli TaxID=363844 RepID=A0ABT9S245_9BURK|nr:hypothetical protein [Variovorax ginsengisoli]MDP9898424.1 hypothetical protein [Variovorax ginsengisoli]
MKTQAAAIKEGYDVDLSGPGRPLGAKGKYPRYEVIPLLTEMEAELIRTLGLIRTLLAEGEVGLDARQNIVQAIDGVLAVAQN